MREVHLAHPSESFFKRMFLEAIAENKCYDLFFYLSEGGTATIDKETGKLVLISKKQIHEMSVKCGTDTSEWEDKMGK